MVWVRTEDAQGRARRCVCHSERSEESPVRTDREILRFAQDDKRERQNVEPGMSNFEVETFEIRYSWFDILPFKRYT